MPCLCACAATKKAEGSHVLQPSEDLNPDTVIFTSCAARDRSYQTSILLPEDSRLRISFGLTRKGGGAALSHNLVSWADDELWSSYRWWKKSVSRLAVDCTYKDRQGLGISSKDKQYTPQSN